MVFRESSWNYLHKFAVMYHNYLFYIILTKQQVPLYKSILFVKTKIRCQHNLKHAVGAHFWVVNYTFKGIYFSQLWNEHNLQSFHGGLAMYNSLWRVMPGFMSWTSFCSTTYIFRFVLTLLQSIPCAHYKQSTISCSYDHCKINLCNFCSLAF